ncbi:glycoside hydrolase family 3 N-terminal domain-containing protein [Kribbella solani]|uniref:glycoside hydrolase family 3 N-terminal domain-containing protein n=1 Tax=Kribbella solani TaxID=236067 RepID=UPI0029B07A1A|nr:glycoside hydrolase family 3 N-terminal domain-containing protein [Kribbella solani]MDX2968384.1 glycoside hydrolase family 3 N-terminal domain-containing protein [Kribbella solani]
MELTRRQTLGLAAATVAGSTVAGPLAADARPDRWVHDTLRRMTLEQKVGQLFVCYAYGAAADTADARNTKLYGVATPAEVVAKYHLGGVIYFTWTDSVKDPRQIAQLSNGLQAAAIANGGVPLQISTDQEYGTVVRVGPPVTQFPGGMPLGATRSAAYARKAGAIAGRELKAIGITTDFAPDADVNLNPLNPVIGVRSISSDPTLVSQLVAAQVKGYQRDGRIVATAKHFPGHGDTDTDSHVGIPEIHHTLAEWTEFDLPPFQAAIRAGIQSIMTAHIVVKALDPSGDPATLSRPILTGILREQLRFDGVVITDSLAMQGVRDKYGDAEIPLRAIEAGVDQLLMPVDPGLAYNSVLAAVRGGRISEARIDESVTRILTLKRGNGLVDRPYVDLTRVAKLIGTPANYAEAQRIADHSTTLLRNDADLLPLSPAPRKILVTGFSPTTLATALQRRGATTVVKDTGTTPTDAKIADALAATGAADLTIVLTNKAWDTEVTDKLAKQQKLVNGLLSTGRPVIVIPVRDPYDVAYFQPAATTLVTYGNTAVSMEALAKVLYGEIAPTGKLPVEIPARPNGTDPAPVLHPFGHGLTFDPRDTRLTVASYNIHAGAGTDNVFDLDRTAQALKALDADLIGLQEVDVHWDARSQWLDTIAELAGKLGMYSAFAPIYDFDPPATGQPRRQYGVGLLSRFPIVRGENHSITRLSTQDPNPVPAPAPGFLEAEVDVRGRRLHAYCTHLDYRGDPTVRRMQVADTTRILAQDRRGDLQVLVGDFNAEATAPELAGLWTRLTDSWTAAGKTTGGPYTYPAVAANKRIDFVTVGAGLRVRRAEVPAEVPVAQAPSDHRPIVADLTFRS